LDTTKARVYPCAPGYISPRDTLIRVLSRHISLTKADNLAQSQFRLFRICHFHPFLMTFVVESMVFQSKMTRMATYIMLINKN
jgi:hypothetical protein